MVLSRSDIAHGGLRRTGVILARNGVGVTRLRQALDAIGGRGHLATLEQGVGHAQSMWDTEVRAGRKGGRPAIFIRGCYGFRRAVYDAIIRFDHKLVGGADLGRRS